MALNRSSALPLLFLALFCATQVSGRVLLQAMASATAAVQTGLGGGNAQAVAMAATNGGTSVAAARATVTGVTNQWMNSGGSGVGWDSTFANTAGNAFGMLANTQPTFTTNAVAQAAVMGGNNVQAMAVAVAKAMAGGGGMATAMGKVLINAINQNGCGAIQPVLVQAAAFARVTGNGQAFAQGTAQAGGNLNQCINSGGGGGGASAGAQAGASNDGGP